MSAPGRGDGRWLGYFEALAAATLWGSSGIFTVHLFRMGLSPESVALLRPVVGSVCLLLYFGVARPGSLRVDRRGVVVLGIGGGLAVGLFHIAYQLSTDAVGVPTTVALLYLAPALVVVASGPLLREWPTWTRLALAGVTLVGVWLSVLGADEVSPMFGTTGLAWGVGAGLGYAAYTLFGRYAAPVYGAAATVVYSTLGSCVVLAATLPFLGDGVQLPPSGQAWAVLVAFGTLTIALAHTLFFDALSRVEASRVSITAAVEPAVAALLATLLLSQGLSGAGWAGIGLIVVGVAGVGVSRDRPVSVSS